MSLLNELSEIVGEAFGAAGFTREFGKVMPSARPDLGDFQCNGALAAAKEAKSNPRAVAESVVARLAGDPRFAALSLAGPGFINITLTQEALSAALQGIAGDERVGLPKATAPQTIVIDFGGPNVAKLMHVGHLRSSVIGDALQRLYRFMGHRVISDVHLGDWGTQMGQIIMELKRRKPELPYFDEGSTGPYPARSPVSVEDLQEIYPAAASACKADPARAEEARAATAQLQAGRPGYHALWRHFVDVSITALRREFESLGVTFDLWKGESDANTLVPDMVADLRAKGLAEESDGALVIRIAEEGDKKELPPVILLKSDGAVLYDTTDLATILDRHRAFDPDLMLYVVDQRQRDHFEKVFRAARKAGYAGKAHLEHVGFGTVNGPDGKPFKTRSGDAITLYDLIAMAKSEAQARIDEAGLGADLAADEQAEIARKVGIGALKFADLVNNRVSDYIFDLGRFTRFEGRTGPYLQYAAVRVKSLLRKAEAEGASPGPVRIVSQAERELALALLLMPQAIEGAAAKRAPNILCDYLFNLAQSFSRFYAADHILSEKDKGLRGSRLTIAATTLAVITRLLDILGIEVPDRM